MYKYAPASRQESVVFGAARPGYKTEQVEAWIKFMQQQDIRRICCLHTKSQLNRYANLLDVYQQIFGFGRVFWLPIQDFHIVSPEVLIHQILPFLAFANECQEKVVVHCSGGDGRTGHILTAWLIAGRALSKQVAIAAVKQTGRNPYEAVVDAPFRGRNPWQVAAKLQMLLDECHRLRRTFA